MREREHGNRDSFGGGGLVAEGEGMYFGDDHWLSFLRRLNRNLLGKFPRCGPRNNNQLNFRKFARRGRASRRVPVTSVAFVRSYVELGRNLRRRIFWILRPSVSTRLFLPRAR